jgi:hypothetical protein
MALRQVLPENKEDTAQILIGSAKGCYCLPAYIDNAYLLHLFYCGYDLPRCSRLA